MRRAVHPEAYPVVERISRGDAAPAEVDHRRQGVPRDAASPPTFADSQFGMPTVTDILAELEKPGRDPRPEFKTATFQEGVEKISDLKPGMQLEGVVTNVTAFGAFVDVGVHQDGLVHISELSDRFVKDPREVVKAGDVVKVRVKEVDVGAQAHRADHEVGRHRPHGRGRDPPRASAPPSPRAAPPPPRPASQPPAESALAAALRRAQERK